MSVSYNAQLDELLQARHLQGYVPSWHAGIAEVLQAKARQIDVPLNQPDVLLIDLAVADDQVLYRCLPCPMQPAVVRKRGETALDPSEAHHLS
jgi:hypothetical protein